MMKKTKFNRMGLIPLFLTFSLVMIFASSVYATGISITPIKSVIRTNVSEQSYIDILIKNPNDYGINVSIVPKFVSSIKYAISSSQFELSPDGEKTVRISVTPSKSGTFKNSIVINGKDAQNSISVMDDITVVSTKKPSTNPIINFFSSLLKFIFR